MRSRLWLLGGESSLSGLHLLSVLQEIDKLRALDHPSVLRLFEPLPFQKRSCGSCDGSDGAGGAASGARAQVSLVLLVLPVLFVLLVMLPHVIDAVGVATTTTAAVAVRCGCSC